MHHRIPVVFAALLSMMLSACDGAPLNNPYSAEDEGKAILYASFSERPKHLDPAIAYSADEYRFIAQIYEPPLQYHYLRRPYTLVPLAAASLPEVRYLNSQEKELSADAEIADIAYTDYVIAIQPGIQYQPHPAFVKTPAGEYAYHHLDDKEIAAIDILDDFAQTASRELTAEDYVYQIKRLAHPKVQSPVAELMKNYIVGFEDFTKSAANADALVLRDLPLQGVESLDRYRYRIRIKGKYPQFKYWLAMPFFAPLPWEAAVFYAQPGLNEKNITLDWYPVGTGAYFMRENNPNRRIVLAKNPNFHGESYPADGDPDDAQRGALADAGKPLPFIEQIVFMLEKESIPYWNKFLQGYYDMSGIASDSFDQAVQFTGRGGVELTPAMREKGIRLEAAVQPSIFYTGFNMRDPVVGGLDEKHRKLRQAISIAVDIEEEISIFLNGRGIPAQGLLPPGIYGYEEGEAGINPYVYEWAGGKPKRKDIAEAKRLLAEAGYPEGRNPASGEALVLYYDTAGGGADDRSSLNWYRKQFAKLGIQLVIRATDYNRFQQKMRDGNAQIYSWGWNADYPDPENFFFLLYGPNAKVVGGENASNYQNPEFDRLFEQMRNMDDGPERFKLIRQMQNIIRRDAPWLFGLHPKSFALYQSWYGNVKPNAMANNTLKYHKLDASARDAKRAAWNRPVFWPLGVMLLVLFAALWPAVRAFRRRGRAMPPN